MLLCTMCISYLPDVHHLHHQSKTSLINTHFLQSCIIGGFEGCKSWQSMCWKDQLQRSMPWELHKQGWWSNSHKRTRAATTSLVSHKNRTPPPHLCQSKRNFLFVFSAILVAIENVTSSGSYNLVHGLSSSNHSFWRGNRIDMHLCCCKETNFQNWLFS